MKPARFDYERPATLGEAFALLNQDNTSVKVLAGGQSLGPMLNFRLVQPELLVDVTRIPVRGWDEVLRMHNPNRSGMVLIQPRGGAVGDLVVIGAGLEKVIYARLQGRLDPDLPSRLGHVLREGGPEEVQRVLSELN